MACIEAAGDFSQRMAFVVGSSDFVGFLFEEGAEIGITADQLPSYNVETFQHFCAAVLLFEDQILPLCHSLVTVVLHFYGVTVKIR